LIRTAEVVELVDGERTAVVDGAPVVVTAGDWAQAASKTIPAVRACFISPKIVRIRTICRLSCCE
jgi:uncharacterized cupin superfamily protein